MAESFGKLFSESLKLKEKERCKDPQISQGLQLFVAVQISVIKKKQLEKEIPGDSPINMKFLYTNLPVYQVVSHSRVRPTVALLTCFFLKYNFVVFLSASICCDTE